MYHPFSSLSSKNLKRTFWTLFLINAFVMVVLNVIGSPLTTKAAPYGIISYEFAGNVQKAEQILESWDINAKLHTALSLGFDYVFLLTYSTTIGIACVWTARILHDSTWPLAHIGIPLAWGQWLAAVLDVIENSALIFMLFGSLVDPWPQIAYWCALFKFLFVFLGVVYAIYGLIVYLLVKVKVTT